MVDTTSSFRVDRAAPPDAPARSDAPATVTVEVGSVRDPRLMESYAALCRYGLAAPAQHPGWVAAWADAAKADTVVAIAMRDGAPVLGLALEVVSAGGCRTARFMGGRHANGNFPAMRRDASPSRGDVAALLAAIGRSRRDIDLIRLERLNGSVMGVANPLLPLKHYPSPNVALAVDLAGGFDAVLERSSGKRKRKKHRSQTRKFEAAGGFRRLAAGTPAEVDAMLDAFFAMKEQRFRKMGIADVFAGAEVQNFFRTLFKQALGPKRPDFVLHALEVDGVPRAVTGSSLCGNRLVCEFGAIREDELAHASPGDFLFFDNIREACGDGLAVYDFSVGDETYKRLWCDLEMRHHDVVVPMSAKGHVYAAGLRVAANAKSLVKNNPLLWRLTKSLRRRVAGQPTAAVDDDA